jgi:hypothetical protein
MRRLDVPGAGRVMSDRERTVLAVLLFFAVVGVLLGDATTLTGAQILAPGLVSDRVLGYLPAALLAFGCGAAWLVLSRRWRGAWPLLPTSASSHWERGLFLVGLFFALLALPVVFAPLQRLIPGFDGLRVPTRVYPFVSFALVYFAARGLDSVLARARGRRRGSILAVVSLALVFELRGSMDWNQWWNRDQIPGIFNRIAEVPGVGAVLHLPIPDYPLEAHYMYFSIAHWRPIVNGYSGYEPPIYLEVKRRVRDELYEESTLEYLQQLGVTHISVHPFQFKMPRERRRVLRWERHWNQGPGARLRQVFVDGKDRLYEILPAASVPPADEMESSSAR